MDKVVAQELTKIMMSGEYTLVKPHWIHFDNRDVWAYWYRFLSSQNMMKGLFTQLFEDYKSELFDGIDIWASEIDYAYIEEISNRKQFQTSWMEILWGQSYQTIKPHDPEGSMICGRRGWVSVGVESGKVTLDVFREANYLDQDTEKPWLVMKNRFFCKPLTIAQVGLTWESVVTQEIYDQWVGKTVEDLKEHIKKIG